DSNYTKVFLRDKRMLLVCRTLKDIGALLDEPRFFRVHDSHIVNMDHTTRYIRGDGGELILDNGQNVPVSRSKKEELMGRLNKA
ncbi:MAG TPA: LytTR family DNA-binding domain-containing protein, partial [Flavobacteriales bacterium]|nr:LytTR family DNA-binding domain-containing protein [Flavobacteriales bacterium]